MQSLPRQMRSSWNSQEEKFYTFSPDSFSFISLNIHIFWHK